MLALRYRLREERRLRQTLKHTTNQRHPAAVHHGLLAGITANRTLWTHCPVFGYQGIILFGITVVASGLWCLEIGLERGCP